MSSEEDGFSASAVMQDWYDALAIAAGLKDPNAALGYEPDDLVGTWIEKFDGRGVITISRGPGESRYSVHIQWENGAETSVWEMTAAPAGAGGELRYEDGTLTVVTAENGRQHEEVKVENGTGSFILNSAYEIMWQDDVGRAGENCVFINAG